jgi:hypothetical protein
MRRYQSYRADTFPRGPSPRSGTRGAFPGRRVVQFALDEPPPMTRSIGHDRPPVGASPARREPRSITTAEIKMRLAERGYDADVRTIQRDMTTLETKFPLICQMDGRTNHWSWARHHPGLDIPRLETPTAITLLLVRDYLLPLLPKPISDELAPYFEKAKKVLKGTKLEQWGRRVRMIRRGPTLKPPTVAPAVLDAVYRALLEDLQLEADYRSRNASEAGRTRVHPLGLVTKEDVLYIVATQDDDQDARQVALHRMSRAETLELPTKAPPGCTLKASIEEERFAYPVDEEKLRLVAAFDETTAAHLTSGRSPVTSISSAASTTWFSEQRCRIRASWGGGCSDSVTGSKCRRRSRRSSGQSRSKWRKSTRRYRRRRFRAAERI